MADNTAYTGHISYLPVIIPNGAAEPVEGVDLSTFKVVGVTLPAQFDGIAMTFSVSTSFAGTYNALHNGTANLSLTVAASRYIAFSTEVAQNFEGVRYFKPISGTNQSTTDTTVLFHVIPYRR